MLSTGEAQHLHPMHILHYRPLDTPLRAIHLPQTLPVMASRLYSKMSIYTIPAVDSLILLHPIQHPQPKTRPLPACNSSPQD